MNSKKVMHDVNTLTRFGYGFCNFGASLLGGILGSFLTLYLTDNVMLSAGFIASMMLMSRLLDGISDLIMGVLVNRTRTRIGIARPWMLFAPFFTVLPVVLIFNVPSGLSETGAKIYVVITYILHTVVFGTMINVAYNTLLIKVSRNPDTRTSIMNISNVMGQLASLLAGSYGIPILMYFGGYEKGYRGLSLLFGIISFVMMTATGVICKEYKDDDANEKDIQTHKKESLGLQLGYLFKNKFAIPLILVYILFFFTMYIKGSAIVYFSRDILGNASYMTELTYAKTIPAILLGAVGIVPFAASRLGKRYTLMAAIVIQLFSDGLILAASSSVSAVMAGNIISGVSGAFMGALLGAMMADVADYINLKNRTDISGLISSISSFGMKIGMGLGSAVLSLGLAVGKYSGEAANAGLPQADSALLAERICYAGIPFVLCIVILGLVFLLDVDKEAAKLK